MDHAFNKKRCSDFGNYLVSLQPSWMMTINYQRPLTGPPEERERRLMADLRHWTVSVLEGLYGKKCAVRNQNDEFLYAAFIQNGSHLGKEHIHLLLRIPYRLWLRFKKIAASHWKTTDDIHVELIRDVEKAVTYCARDLVIEPDRIFFSNQFRR
jgi:hypothetical protein